MIGYKTINTLFNLFNEQCYYIDIFFGFFFFFFLVLPSKQDLIDY
jgi:hypothetical protein